MPCRHTAQFEAIIRLRVLAILIYYPLNTPVATHTVICVHNYGKVVFVVHMQNTSKIVNRGFPKFIHLL